MILFRILIGILIGMATTNRGHLTSQPLNPQQALFSMSQGNSIDERLADNDGVKYFLRDSSYWTKAAFTAALRGERNVMVRLRLLYIADRLDPLSIDQHLVRQIATNTLKNDVLAPRSAVERAMAKACLGAHGQIYDHHACKCSAARSTPDDVLVKKILKFDTNYIRPNTDDSGKRATVLTKRISDMMVGRKKAYRPAHPRHVPAALLQREARVRSIVLSKIVALAESRQLGERGFMAVEIALMRYDPVRAIAFARRNLAAMAKLGCGVSTFRAFGDSSDIARLEQIDRFTNVDPEIKGMFARVRATLAARGNR